MPAQYFNNSVSSRLHYEVADCIRSSSCVGRAPCPGPPPTAHSCPQTRKEVAARHGHSDLTLPPPHRDTLGVHRLRTSHERLFYIKRSNQTTRQDPGESRLLFPELPSQKPRSSGLWGAPGGECSLPPQNPAPQRKPRWTQRSRASRITKTGLCTPTQAKHDQLGAGSVPLPCLRCSLSAAQPGCPPIAAGTPPGTPGHITGGTLGLKAWTAEKVPRQGTAKCTRMSERHKNPGQRKRLSLDPI